MECEGPFRVFICNCATVCQLSRGEGGPPAHLHSDVDVTVRQRDRETVPS
jgi:hypothetical protein